jgi:gluconokinase
MKDVPLRSPAAKVGGLVHFGRMLDKIRVHARGELPAEYQPNLGKGFDAKCCAFLHIDYGGLAEKVKQGANDEELLQWSFTAGRHPNEAEITMWNEFMRKFGWRDHATEILVRRKREADMAGRADIETMFQFIDADEGRPVAIALQPRLYER